MPKNLNNKNYYYRSYDDDRDDTIFLLIIVLVVWSIYWAIFHLIDWLLGDWVVWYLEPFTVFLWLPFVVLSDHYGSNPLHWWPLFWGHKIYIIDTSTPVSFYDYARLVERNGGPFNAYVGVNESRGPYIKFRRRKDALFYALKNF
jgi:hypothetical protein